MHSSLLWQGLKPSLERTESERIQKERERTYKATEEPIYPCHAKGTHLRPQDFLVRLGDSIYFPYPPYGRVSKKV